MDSDENCGKFFDARGAYDIVRVMAGERCRTKRTLYEEWFAALDFPPYAAGGSWDSLSQCIFDLDWPPFDAATKILLVQDKADRLLIDEPNGRSVFLDILRGAPDEFATRRLHGRAMDLNRNASLTIAFETDLHGYGRLNAILASSGITA
jgi:hypothetical protein